jgi:hypothetical protein
LLASLALIVGLLRANARYFYCPIMDRVVAESCCAPAADGADEQAAPPSLRATDCCQAKQVGSLPRTAAPPGHDALEAPLLGLLSPVIWPAPRAPAHRNPRALDARHTGPPRPSEARARAMVYLI